MKKLFVFLCSLTLILLMNRSPVQAANNPRNIYEVKPGDTLWKLSQAFNSSVQLIKSANRLSSDIIFVGQK